MARGYWIKVLESTILDPFLTAQDLWVLLRLMITCARKATNVLSPTDLKRVQAGITRDLAVQELASIGTGLATAGPKMGSTGRKRVRVGRILAKLRKCEYVEGDMGHGVTVTSYAVPVGRTDTTVRNVDRDGDRNKDGDGDARATGAPQRRADARASLNGNGGDEQRHQQRPESKALWKLAADWGPIPAHMCSLTAQASETTVAYALEIQRNGTVREQWKYLWACAHPQKTQKNPGGTRKWPSDAMLKEAAKRIDAEREVPGPLGVAAAALTRQFGKGKV